MKEQAHDPLADPVVDLPGETAALVFLPLHKLLGERFKRLLALGQAGVQPCALDRPGHQAGHRPEQLDIPAGELAAELGMHVQDADQVAERATATAAARSETLSLR